MRRAGLRAETARRLSGAAAHREPWAPHARARRRRGRGDAAAPTAQSRRARLILLVAIVVVGLLSVGARCAHLQLVRAATLLEQARSQQEKAITLDPHRGPILDRNGKELALSLAVDSIFADPTEVGDDAAAAARRLAPVLAQKPAEVRDRLEGDRHFVWLKRKVTPEVRRQVEALGIKGIGFVRESRRYYPKRGLAAHVLGACGMDNQGLAGLEFAYDTAIQGTPGRIQFLRDGRGGRVLDRSRVEPVAGTGLVLTIDEVIQHIADRELDAAMSEFSPVGASVVVLRPQTGELLALASRPGFDPNDYSDAREESRKNRAVSDYYEPGSTFKVVTAAAALDAGRVRPNEVIWCENGSIVVGKHRFKEDRLPYGNLTFTEVLAKSSNVGAIKVGARLGGQEFLDYIRAFGFGRKSGIELPGESPGMLREVADWSGLSQASIAMGQEIGATPLQLAAALATVANDGVYVKPFVVGATVGPDGKREPPRPASPALSHRVIEANTARALRRMLQSVTVDGTGKAAAVRGYTVGGKTGTAQKIDASGRYSHGKYVSWFSGFVPADDPALVIVVMVDEPRGPKFHGGDVAAPVFSRIALPVLQYLGVPADSEAPLLFDRSVRASLREAVAPRGGDRALPARDDRRPAAGRISGTARSSGAAEASLASLIMPVASRAVVGGGDAAPAPGPTMPDVSGMSLRQASEALAIAGLVCRTERSGERVIRQEPEPGAPVSSGRCAVFF